MDTASSTPSTGGDASAPAPSTETFVPPAPVVTPASALPPVHDFALPPHELGKRNASYGALISIIIILAIVVVGAFYSWGERIEKNNVQPVINEVPGVTAPATP